MKSSLSTSMLAIAATALGMSSSTSAPKYLRPSPPVFIPRVLMMSRPGLSQRPRTNQRKVRKARRQRHAAGLKHAFRA